MITFIGRQGTEMVRETEHKQLQTRGLINKQTITKITNVVHWPFE
jgi:hypothetical protein